MLRLPSIGHPLLSHHEKKRGGGSIINISFRKMGMKPSAGLDYYSVRQKRPLNHGCSKSQAGGMGVKFGIRSQCHLPRPDQDLN